MSSRAALTALTALAALTALGCADDPREGRAELRERCGAEPRPPARCDRLPDRDAKRLCEQDDLSDAECAVGHPDAYCRALDDPTEERRRGDNAYIQCVDEAIAPLPDA